MGRYVSTELSNLVLRGTAVEAYLCFDYQRHMKCSAKPAIDFCIENDSLTHQ